MKMMLSTSKRFICNDKKKKKKKSCLKFHQLSLNLGKAIKETLVEEVPPCGRIAGWKIAENSSSVLLVHG